MSNAFLDHVRQGAEEYLWILSKCYPQKSALKLLGDKFMLPRDMLSLFDA
jgi:hypothetical protein